MATVSTQTLRTVNSNVSVSLVKDGSDDLFGNFGEESLIADADEYEGDLIGGYPV